MRTLFRRSVQLLSVALLMLIFTLSAEAASCTCGLSTKPHDSSHDKVWTSNGESGHTVLCQGCINNKHAKTCAQVILTANEAHVITITGTGSSRTQSCSKCGFSAPAPCAHANADWVNKASLTTSAKCIKFCKECQSVVAEKSHNPKYKDIGSGHEVTCRDCGYTIAVQQNHTYTYKYDKMALPSDPSATTIVNSMPVSASTHHFTHSTCKECGVVNTYYEEHTWRGNSCSQCGLTKTVLTKVSKLKASQIGRGKHNVTTIRAGWRWDGMRWHYQKAGKSHSYNYKAKISWKKAKGASGYVYSVDQARIKAGTALANAWGCTFTRKTSVKAQFSFSRKTKKTFIYVAPVSGYGIIGKSSKVKIKLK